MPRVKGWYAAVAALLTLLPQRAPAAQSLTEAARELARKIASVAGRDSVSFTIRSTSSLGPSEIAQARSIFAAEFRLEQQAPVDARVTLSENQVNYLLVAEVRRGDERRVMISSWPRSGSPPAGMVSAVLLEKRLVWEQQEPILDLAVAADTAVVLSPSKLLMLARRNGAWEIAQSVPISGARASRDPRGRVVLNAGALDVFLPGLSCHGALQSLTAIECTPGPQPWPIEQGLAADFSSDRNYFEGRIAAPVNKSVSPFFSAAFSGEGWLLAGTDGHVRILDRSLEPAGNAAVSWGSDIAGVRSRCGAGRQILATTASDAGEPDSVGIFEIVNRELRAAGSPAPFSGPVTALWSAGEGLAAAVSRDAVTGRYSAFILAISCGS